MLNKTILTMENKVKDNREEQRIERDAEKYINDSGIFQETEWAVNIAESSYITGATIEANRAKVLIECLNEILPLHTGYKEDGEMISTSTGYKIRKALQDYNKK